MKNFDRIPKPPRDRRKLCKPKKPDIRKIILDCRNWIKHCNGTLTKEDLEERYER